MKKLNKKGFAITAILYTMLVLTVLLMFLIIGVLADRRVTLNKMSSKVKEELDDVNNGGTVKPTPNGLYAAVQAVAGDKTDAGINFFPTVTGADDYPFVNLQENGAYLKKETASDDYPVYYYRGDVDNWVVFANQCWRIVRTTSTGGVKLIYSGYPTMGAYDFTTGTAAVSCNSVYWDLVYGGKAGKSNFGESSLYSSSTIKGVVDNYLANNVYITPYVGYLETMKLCNDNADTTWQNLKNKKMEFSCPKTVESKVGLLDAEEVVRAGGIVTGEKVRINYYLRINQPTLADVSRNDYVNLYNVNYVTMTSGRYSTTNKLGIVYIGGEGQIDTADFKTTQYGVRPVISLVPGVTYEEGGIGTKDNPYVIVGANA